MKKYLILFLLVAPLVAQTNRLKDKTEAATPAGDDWLFLDGATNGVRKLAPGYPLNRANHTGSQAISTVTGLQAALDAKETPAAAQTKADAAQAAAIAAASTDATTKANAAQAAAIAAAATDATTKADAAQAAAIQRANHTGSQTISTVTGLQAALDAKETPAAAQAKADAAQTAAISAASSDATTKANAAQAAAIAAAATDATTKANAAQAAAVQRSNHTGTQAASTITQLPVEICVALSDETTAITTGTNKVTMRAPFAFTITGVRASLTTASSSGLPTVDINESGTTIMAVTKLTIDATEKTSVTAATAAVVSDTAIANDAELTFDVDNAGTGTTGLKIWILGYR